MSESGSGERAPSAHAPLKGHIPVLDGVRGLAIILVLFFHLSIIKPIVERSADDPAQPAPRATLDDSDTSITAAPETGRIHPLDRAYMRLTRVGWSGVDLFFVLSGFLITGILFDAKGRSHYFRNFYARRTLRIFPLYYAVLAFFLIVLPMLPLPRSPGIREFVADYVALREHQAWLWLYLSNFFTAIHGWEGHGIPDVLWSLAIEEQFYVVWPTIVYFCSRRGMMRVCAGAAAMALAFRTWMVLTGADPIDTYVVTPSRVDALAIGGFLALWVRGPGGIGAIAPWASRTFLVAGVATVAMFIWRGTEKSEYDPVVQSVGFTLIALWFASFIGLALAGAAGVRGGGFAAPVLAPFFANPVMRFFGKYSYAMYLFHLPVRTVVSMKFDRPDFVKLAIGGSQLPGQILFLLACTAGTVIAAMISWHLYEKQFLKLKKFFPTSQPLSQEQR